MAFVVVAFVAIEVDGACWTQAQFAGRGGEPARAESCLRPAINNVIFVVVSP